MNLAIAENRVQQQLTAQMVEERLEEAWRTLKALYVRGTWPAGHRSSMPEPIRNAWDASLEPPPPAAIRAMDDLGIPRDTRGDALTAALRRAGVPDGVVRSISSYRSSAPVRLPPDARAITRMDEAIGWIALAGDEFEVERLVRDHYHKPDWATQRCHLRRKALWWRSAGLSWRRLAPVLGVSYEQARNLYNEAVRRIVARVS